MTSIIWRCVVYYDFDVVLKCYFLRSVDLTNIDVSILFEQIHLYSDGGLDISQCGKYTMLCAHLSYVRDKIFYLHTFCPSFIPIFLDPSVFHS